MTVTIQFDSKLPAGVCTSLWLLDYYYSQGKHGPILIYIAQPFYFFPLISLMHISKTTRRALIPWVCSCTLLCDWMAHRFPEVRARKWFKYEKQTCWSNDKTIGRNCFKISTRPEGFSFLVSRWSCDRQRRSRDLSPWSRGLDSTVALKTKRTLQHPGYKISSSQFRNYLSAKCQLGT